MTAKEKHETAQTRLAGTSISVVLNVNVDWVREVPTELFRFFLC